MDKGKILRFGLLQFIGTAVFTLGVASLVVAGLGAGPLDAAAYFASVKFGLTQGMWTFILNGFLALLLLLFQRKPAIIFNIVMLIFIGVLIDGWIYLLEKIYTISLPTTLYMTSGMAPALILAIIGFVTIGFGVSVLIHNELVLSPLDEFTVFLSGFTKKYFVAKITIDGSFLILAIILGLIGDKPLSAQINFFSFIIVFGLGVYINLLLDLYKKRKEGKNATK